MSNYTKTYKLKKPLGTENYNVEDQNTNMNIIDEELEKQGKQINDCLQPATKDKLGMVKIGENLTITKEGKLNGTAPYTHPNDTNTRHVTDTQINTWNNKAPAHDHPYIPISASCNKNWNWNGQDGQPTWLWGGNDPNNMFVYNPANFSVNYANSAANADKLGGMTLNQIQILIDKAKEGDDVILCASDTKRVVMNKYFEKEKSNDSEYEYYKLLSFIPKHDGTIKIKITGSLHFSRNGGAAQHNLGISIRSISPYIAGKDYETWIQSLSNYQINPKSSTTNVDVFWKMFNAPDLTMFPRSTDASGNLRSYGYKDVNISVYVPFPISPEMVCEVNTALAISVKKNEPFMLVYRVESKDNSLWTYPIKLNEISICYDERRI